MPSGTPGHGSIGKRSPPAPTSLESRVASATATIYAAAIAARSPVCCALNAVERGGYVLGVCIWFSGPDMPRRERSREGGRSGLPRVKLRSGHGHCLPERRGTGRNGLASENQSPRRHRHRWSPGWLQLRRLSTLRRHSGPLSGLSRAERPCGAWRLRPGCLQWFSGPDRNGRSSRSVA